MSKSKNDLAWEKIFGKYRILDEISANGRFDIHSTKINEFREARLMTKFDHKSQLPKLFTDNKISILPTSRGGYTIGEFEAFYDFDKDEVEIAKIKFPTFLESLDHKEITSEATAINCAFVSRILTDFTQEENLVPTVSGRMSSSSFSFDIDSPKGRVNLKVENSQVEIDGGFEGDLSLTLIEAKNYISDDFLIRQIYYPYKLWSRKIKKHTRNIFLTYSNGIFHLREYAFKDINHYNSLVLVKQKKYAIQDGTFNIETIDDIYRRTPIIKEPTLPFPQADSFERVINLCELLKQKEFLTKEEVTQNYDFDSRQTDYYSNAGKYLGLLEIGKDPVSTQKRCFLSKKGKQVFNLNLVDRQKEFVKLIISHGVFKDTLKKCLEDGEMPDKDNIVEIMKSSKLHNVHADTTYYRRASTVSGWIQWIMDQIED
jgi:hypothetical protein